MRLASLVLAVDSQVPYDVFGIPTVFVFRGSGFRVSGFRGLGLWGLGFRTLGLGVYVSFRPGSNGF